MSRSDSRLCVAEVPDLGFLFRDAVTGDSDQKTVSLYIPHCVCAVSLIYIYYFISLSLVSLMSLTNKHRPFIGDSERDTANLLSLF